MPAEKITGMDEIGGAPADGDQFVIVDVSDTSEAATGTTKRVNASRLARVGLSNTFLGSISIIAGIFGLQLAQNETANTNNTAAIIGRQYDSIANKIAGVIIQGTSTENTIQIGNGIAGANSPTRVAIGVASAIGTSAGSVLNTMLVRAGAVSIGPSVSDPAASTCLDLQGTTGALLLPRLTSTQRDALTATNGMVIYNSTTNKVQARAAGTWVDLH